MKKAVRDIGSIRKSTVGGQTIVGISIGRLNVSDWIANLLLLREQLIEGFFVISGNTTLDVTLGGEHSSGSVRQHRFSLRIGRSSLDYLLTYLLKFYRDDVAEVDHIDVEATADGEEFYFTFVSDTSLPSVNEEEAKKRLGL